MVNKLSLMTRQKAYQKIVICEKLILLLELLVKSDDNLRFISVAFLSVILIYQAVKFIILL